VSTKAAASIEAPPHNTASPDPASNITAPSALPADGRIEQLREWLEQRYPDAELDEDSDLTDGVVEDSLAFVELLVLVEDLRGTPIPAADVDLENFRTLRIIAARFFDTVAAGDGQ
jgi:acyl carrier protein